MNKYILLSLCLITGSASALTPATKELFNAIETINVGAFKRALESANINEVDANGATPAMMAVNKLVELKLRRNNKVSPLWLSIPTGIVAGATAFAVSTLVFSKLHRWQQKRSQRNALESERTARFSVSSPVAPSLRSGDSNDSPMEGTQLKTTQRRRPISEINYELHKVPFFIDKRVGYALGEAVLLGGSATAGTYAGIYSNRLYTSLLGISKLQQQEKELEAMIETLVTSPNFNGKVVYSATGKTLAQMIDAALAPAMITYQVAHTYIHHTGEIATGSKPKLASSTPCTFYIMTTPYTLKHKEFNAIIKPLFTKLATTLAAR